MNKKSEHFLLYTISDDWTPLSDFHVVLQKLEPERFDRAFVLDAMRSLGERGLIRFGSFTAPVRPWTPWELSVEDSISRVAHGFDEHVGYLASSDGEVHHTEILRAEITEAGVELLRELGDPYEIHGDPWIDDLSG
ncbi:hypothetical protein [Nocardia asteroides]|uniref:hypothetical protein n=1 Tax=Nocardia asteroides TaxID=1824 RepID=UPI001E3FEE66|nr:hypothetical protein [Nocardia asteroides]UGT60880.1 hypothetical protein LTT61_27635 [Nocardia asteroides]